MKNNNFVMTKICKKCKKEKELNEFHKRKNSKDGHRNECIICYRECKRIYRLNNLEKVKNLKRIRENDYSEEEKMIKKSRKNELGRKYYHKSMMDPDFRLKEKIRRRQRHLKRLEEDPLYKIRIAYTRRLNKCIKRFNIKNVYFLNELGCSLAEFKIYIESKFEEWMTWENYGKYNGEINYGWDIDHIIPISLATTEDEFHKLCHYTNLQPLCSKINRDIKKDKIENPQ